MTSSGTDAAALCVLLDVRHPLAYLALGPAIALGRELGIEIDWLPLRVPPLKAPSLPQPGDDRGTRHRRHRAQAIAREIETYAGAQGLVLRDCYRSPDCTALELGWLWLRGRHPEVLPAFLVEAFRAYWALELDPSDAEAVAKRVESLAGRGDEFRAWSAGEGPDTAARLAAELRERGFSGVPGYLVEDEFFLGRQHLPMIRWILQGRQGPGPI